MNEPLKSADVKTDMEKPRFVSFSPWLLESYVKIAIIQRLQDFVDAFSDCR